MKPEAQRIAIAKACGLSEIGTMYEGLMHAGTGTFLEVPDYLHSLDAMHEAEKVLNKDQRSAYCYEHLSNVAGGLRNMVSATAAQRAEAFLRTLNLWTQNS